MFSTTDSQCWEKKCWTWCLKKKPLNKLDSWTQLSGQIFHLLKCDNAVCFLSLCFIVAIWMFLHSNWLKLAIWRPHHWLFFHNDLFYKLKGLLKKKKTYENLYFQSIYYLQVSKFTFAKVLGIKWQAVSRQCLQQQLVAGPPARLSDGGSHTLHGSNALEECRLAMEANQLIKLRQNTVALDLLLLWKLQLRRKH